MDGVQWDGKSLFYAFEAFWVLIVTPVALVYLFVIRRHVRPRPDNYVGKFRRSDGSIVHVARMPSKQLWACTDEQPGVEPKPIGYVTGREVMSWHKLSSTPDGQDCISRPK